MNNCMIENGSWKCSGGGLLMTKKHCFQKLMWHWIDKTLVPLLETWFYSILTWLTIASIIQCGVKLQPIPNFNGATIEVWDLIINFIPHFTGCVITYPCLKSTIVSALSGHLLSFTRCCQYCEMLNVRAIVFFLQLFTSLGCFCPWTFFLKNGLDWFPWTSFISYLHTILRIISRSVSGLATDSP